MRHSTVVAYLALFVALGGTSYAAAELSKGSVTSREIKDGSVRARDLKRNARPPTNARIAQVVETSMTSEEVLGALSGAVKGEKGDKGDPGATGPQGVAGPQGERGATGATGPRGSALGFAHVGANGIIDPARSSNNVIVYKPSGTQGLYCVKATDATVRSAYVVIDANDSLTARALLRVPPTGTFCDGYPLEVITLEEDGTTSAFAGFFLTLN